MEFNFDEPMEFDVTKDELDAFAPDNVTPSDFDQQPLNGVISEAVKVDPARAAHQRRVQRVTGLPVDMIDASTDAEYKRRKIIGQDLSKHPRTASFLQDPDNAAIAQDDIPVLKEVEKWLDTTKTFKNFGSTLLNDVRTMGQGYRISALEGIGSSLTRPNPVNAVFNAFGVSSPGDIFSATLFGSGDGIPWTLADVEAAKEAGIQEAIENIKQLSAENQKLTPEDLNILESGVRSGFHSVAMGSVALSAGLATRSANVALALGGSQTYASSYARGREEGLSDDRARVFATVDAAIEVATEYFPTKALEAMFKGTEGFRKALTQFFVGDTLGEQAATLLQSFNAYVFGLDKEIENAPTLAEKIDIQLERQAVTFVATIVAGGAQTGAVEGTRRAIGYIDTKAKKTENLAKKEAQALDTLSTLAKASKTQTLDSDTFAQMFAGETTEVRIQREALEQFLFENRLQIQAGLSPELELLQTALDMTEDGINEVTLPLGVYASKIAGNGHHEALRDNVKMAPESLFPSELESVSQEEKESIDRLIEEADVKLAREEEVKKVFEITKQQLIDTGRVSPEQAEIVSQLAATWINVFAKSNGESVTEAFDRSGLQFKGPEGDTSELRRGYYDPVTNVIRLLNTSNPSTVLHEFGHFMYEQEKRMGRDADIKNWFFSEKEMVATEANRLIGNGIVFTKPKPVPVAEAEIAPVPNIDSEVDRAFGLDPETTQDIGRTWSAAPTPVEYPFGLRDDTTPAPPEQATIDRDPQIKLSAADDSGIAPMPPGPVQVQSEAPTAPQESSPLSREKQQQIKELEQEYEKLKKSETIHKSLSRAGGLNREAWLQDGVDPESFKQKVKVFGKPLFPKSGGMTPDSVAEYLNETAFRGKTDYTANEAIDVVSDMLRDDIYVDPNVDSNLEAISYAIDGIMYGDMLFQGDIRFDGVKEVTPQDIENYMDTGTTGDVLKDKVILHATHEIFARGFETYLLTGKAPTRGLRRIFEKFATLLTEVYRRVRGNMLVDISGGRAIYDRLLTADSEINLAEIREGIEPLFTDAVMAGKANMTDEEFRKHKEKQSERTDKAKKTLRDRLIEEIRRLQEEWWRDEKAAVKEELRSEVAQKPIHVTREKLRTGNVKLDRTELKERLGVKTVPPGFAKMTANAGVPIDQAALIMGYPTEQAFMEDLKNSPTLEQDLEILAEAEMINRHGDVLNDGTIEQRADEALRDEDRARFLHTELVALRRGTNVKTLKLQVTRDVARQRIEKLTTRELNPNKYRKAEKEAAKQAAAFLREGNLDGAARAKSQEILFHYLARESEAAVKLATKIAERAKRYSKKAVQQPIISAGEGYWEQLVSILVRFDFRKNVSGADQAKTKEALATWVARQNGEMGDEISIPASIANENYATHWKDVPVSDLKGIDTALRSIENAAKNANKIELEGQKEDLNAIVDQVIGTMAGMRTVFKGTRARDEGPTGFFTKDGREGYRKKIAGWVDGGMAKMSKTPMIMKWIDNAEFGLMTKMVSVRFTKAISDYRDLWKETAEPVTKTIAEHIKKHAKRMHTKTNIPELGDDQLWGHQLLLVMLNAGNHQNLRKMLLGEGWITEDKPENITTDNPVIQAVMKQMTPEDMELVSTIHKQMETLYKPMRDVSRRTSGVIPPQVVATPIKTPWGVTYPGGYYPIDYDRDRGTKEQMETVGKYQDQRAALTNSPFSSVGSIQQSVQVGATETRTDFYAPILFEAAVIPKHFQEVIHYITHHEAVRDVNRLFRHPKLAPEIKRVLGPEEQSKLLPWLNDVATQGRSTESADLGQTIFRNFRLGTTYAYLGYKISTILVQPLGLLAVASKLGRKRVFEGMRYMASTMPSPTRKGFGLTLDTPWEARDFAIKHSKVLKDRLISHDREINEVQKRLKGKSGWLDSQRRVSMMGIAYVQLYSVDMPAWHAAYKHQFDQTEIHEDAANFADQVVKETQGSADLVDSAELLRSNNEFSRTFFAFMTYFSAHWNMTRDLGRKVKRREISPTRAASAMFYLYVANTIADMFIKGDLDIFGDDDEDEGSLLGKIAIGSAKAPIQGVPYARDVVDALVYGFDLRMSPTLQLVEDTAKAMYNVGGKTFGDNDNDITAFEAKKIFTGVGVGLKIPGTLQAWASGEHIYDVLRNGEDFSMTELWRGPERKD